MPFIAIFILMIVFSGLKVQSQSYEAMLKAHREQYKKEFLEDERSPLKKKDIRHLRFYSPDSSYVVSARFNQLTDTIGFDMQTHSGVIKRYYLFGKVSFVMRNQPQELTIYQSEKLRTQQGFEDYLFMPFTDETNYKTTFGGGRYLDFRMSDIVQGTLKIDFNKAYNPYCAFKGGYACPIPPKENDLNVLIEAGEKLYGKKMKH
jgi:uncharacterized protein (DUF1684 family)